MNVLASRPRPSGLPLLATVLCLVVGMAGVARSAPAPPGPRTLGPPPPAQVRRVVTLAPSLTEMVLAMGAGGTLVGVSRFDDAKQVEKLPRPEPTWSAPGAATNWAGPMRADESRDGMKRQDTPQVGVQ